MTILIAPLTTFAWWMTLNSLVFGWFFGLIAILVAGIFLGGVLLSLLWHIKLQAN